jgi:hypothetical protein
MALAPMKKLPGVMPASAFAAGRHIFVYVL